MPVLTRSRETLFARKLTENQTTARSRISALEPAEAKNVFVCDLRGDERHAHPEIACGARSAPGEGTPTRIRKRIRSGVEVERRSGDWNVRAAVQNNFRTFPKNFCNMKPSDFSRSKSTKRGARRMRYDVQMPQHLEVAHRLAS
jgi:hypothetical protein